MSALVTIERYLDFARSPALDAGLDRVFFEASNTKDFESDAARLAFRQRWLGRYLTQEPSCAFLALDSVRKVAGYLVGAVDDPALSGRFDDIGYFANFRDLTRRYPAHLHVNLAPGFRNQGIGGHLIDAFIAEAKRQGAPGAHVVTSAGARNVRFYNRNGFFEAGRRGEGSHQIVFLARAL